MRICLIGAGNVGTQLGLAFYEAGHQITQVFSRSLKRAEKLARVISSEAIDDFLKLNSDVDVIILAVKDDAISGVSEQIHRHRHDTLILHTAGSVPMTVFGDHRRHGVIWPVQTLSSSSRIDMRNVPLAIVGDTLEATRTIERLAKSVSNHVYHIDDTQRAFLHLAATFANNFSNHLYTLSGQIAQAHDIPFEILKPLILETARKIQHISPGEAQTGAAIRGDKGTMTRHLALLKDRPDLQRIYRSLSRSIQAIKK